jgi:hypothetical protein
MLQIPGYYLDIAFKGLPAIAIYLHLKAWHLGLRDDERGQWSVLGLIFYPSRTRFLPRMLNRFARDV